MRVSGGEFGLAAKEMDNRIVKEGMIETEWMRKQLGKTNSIVNAGQCLIGIAQQPFTERPVIARTKPGIVSAEAECKRPMPIDVIKATALVAMAAR